MWGLPSMRNVLGSLCGTHHDLSYEALIVGCAESCLSVEETSTNFA